MSDTEEEPSAKLLKTCHENESISHSGNGELIPTQESPLMGLPKEIWSIVFEYIPQNDLVSHRLVSKKWCENISTLGTFHVIFKDDQSESDVEALCNLRVRSCEIRRLHKPFLLQLSNEGLLKKVTFAPTSAENVKSILTKFPNIESLAFYTLLNLDKHFDPNEDYKSILEHLKCLKEIDIGIHSISERPTLSSSIFHTIIGSGNITFPALRKVRLCFSVSSSQNWKHLFNWLGRHRSTLSSLDLNCSCHSENEITDDDLFEINMKNLLSLKLKSLLVADNSSHSAVHSIYNQLLSVQNSLEYLCVNYHGVNINTYIQAIKNSSKTLRSVKCFHVLLTERAVALDSSLFQSNRLQEFVFQCIPTVVCVVLEWDGIRRYSASVVGWQLPKSIKRLHIQGCSVPTQDLVNLYDNKYTALEELILIDVGDTKGFGITLSVFCKLILLLSQLKIFRLNATFGATPETPEGEKELKNWRSIMDLGKALEVYKTEEEDSEVVHVFNLSDKVLKEQFLSVLQFAIEPDVSL